MNGETITQLPVGAALTGVEVTPFVQSGITVQITAAQVAAFAAGPGAGTVTSVTGNNANGFFWSIANPTTTPQLTLSTTVNGFLQGNGTAVSAAGTVGSGSSLVTANGVTGSGSTAVLSTSPTISGLTVTGSFTATGLVTNASLQNNAVTVAGKSVSLGSSITLAASDLTNGTTGSGSIVLAGAPTFTNTIQLGTVSTTTGQLILANSASANTTTIQAGNAAAARTYTWPTNFGAAGSVLQDAAGNGTLSWGAGSAGAGTVTTVSVVSANGFAGTVANASTTPAITLTTSITGILSGNGTAISAAASTGSGSVVLATSPTIGTPSISSPTITGHATIEGVTATGATGTGKFVFDTSPTLVTPVIGTATGTSLTLGTVSSVTGTLKLANSASANLTTIQAGNSSAWTLTLPTGPGTNTFVLQTDGAGNTSWVTPATGTGGGTVTTVSVTTANGFAGVVANATSTPAISISTNVTGILQGNGTAISAASTTGSGAVVLATSPTLVTPNIGAATATTINGATYPPTITLTTDVTGSGTGTIAATIATNAVTNAKLRTSAGLSVIGRSVNTSGNVADITGTAGQVLVVNAAGTALAFGAVQPAGGGTGATTLTNHSVLVGAGTNTITQVGPGAAGSFFTGQGALVDPAFTSTPVLGINQVTTGTLTFANGALGGAGATIQNRSATSAFNFNIPATAGIPGQALVSGGGGTSPMTWGLANPTVIGGSPVWNSTSNGIVIDGQGLINALAYGADSSGSADSTTAINNALATGKLVYLPQGTYKISGTLNVTANTSGLVGDTQRGTIINSTVTTGDCISVTDATFGVYIGNLTVTRNSLATSGAGIKFNGSTTGNDFANIFNVRVFNHNIGLDLGGVAAGYITQVLSVSNRSHGVKITGGTTAMQWQMERIDSLANGGDGFNMTGSGATPCGQWKGLKSNANTGKGFSSTGVAALRLSDCFFGGDGSHEVFIATGGSTYKHTLTNIGTEFSTAGNGFFFDSTIEHGVSMVNCWGTGHALSGVINNSTKNVFISGGHFIGNGGISTVGNTFGILNNSTGSITIVGTQAPTSGTQTGGIQINAGSTAGTTVGCNATVTNNATLPSNTGNY